MIVQQLLDWLSQAGASLLTLIPPLPGGVNDAVDGTVSSLDYVTGWLAPLGVVVPFEAFNGIIVGVVALLAFWLVMIPLRVTFARLTGRS